MKNSGKRKRKISIILVIAMLVSVLTSNYTNQVSAASIPQQTIMQTAPLNFSLGSVYSQDDLTSPPAIDVTDAPSGGVDVTDAPTDNSNTTDENNLENSESPIVLPTEAITSPSALIANIAGWHTKTTIEKTPADGSPIVTWDDTTSTDCVVNSGDILKYSFVTSKIKVGNPEINDTFEISISADLFREDNPLFGANPPHYLDGTPIFSANSFKNYALTQHVDGNMYYDYVLEFDQSRTTSQTNFDTLTTFQISFELTIDSNSIKEFDSNPVTISGGSDVTITFVPEPQPGENGTPAATKSIGGVWRKDSNGKNIKIGNNSNTIVHNGDYILFNVGAKNTSTTEKAKLSVLYEQLPFGYDADVAKNSAKGWVLSNPQPADVIAKSATQYEYHLDPQITINPNGSWGSVPFYATVKGFYDEATGKDVPIQNASALANIAVADSGNTNGGQGSGPVGPNYRGTDNYDGAVQVYLTQNGQNGQNKFEYFKNNTVEYFQIKFINQGNMPIKNPTVSIYLPRGYFLITPENNPGNIYGSNFNYLDNGWSSIKALYKITQYPSFDPSYEIMRTWSDSIEVYEYTFNQTIPVGGSVQINSNGGKGIPIVAVDPNDYEKNVTLNSPAKDYYNTLKISDFYIAAEISSFENFEATKSTDGFIDGAEVPVIFDTDSTPDSNPFNDLYDNRTGFTDKYYGITTGIKEKDNNVNQRAKLT